MSSDSLNKVDTGQHSGTHPWYDHQRERKYGGAQSRNTNKEEFDIRSNHQLYSIEMGPLVTGRRKHWRGKCDH